MGPSKLFALCFAFLASQLGFAAPVKNTCPDNALFETVDDCPWAALTREAQNSNTSLKTLLKDSTLGPMLEKDAASVFYKTLWGTSINFDDGEKKIIVSPNISKELTELFKVKPLWDEKNKLMHAGVQHTYGYLFSNLYTSFGYKRARWVRNELESGFNLSPDLLGPKAKEGTFFTNITYFLGNICFQDNLKTLNLLKTSPESQTVSEELKNFAYSKLSISRLEETVLFDEHTVVLRTDIVNFLSQPSDLKANSALLIYSVLDSRQDGPQIISGFPVNAAFAQRLFQEKNLGTNQNITTRYNAWVDKVTGVNPPLKGTRQKTK